ncbi:MAG: hypothetical protein ABI402_04015 [Ferruginibacter sp.]
MKAVLSIVFCLVVFISSAQKMEPYPSSDSIVISGIVIKQIVIPLNDISSMADTSFPTLKILNHHGEFKVNYANVKAVALKRIFEKNLLSSAKPKEMYSFYFVCKAIDGYTAVYSYNELFNDDAKIFIVTAYDDLNLKTMPEKPMLLFMSAPATGKIGMRGLKSIEVKKVE